MRPSWTFLAEEPQDLDTTQFSAAQAYQEDDKTLLVVHMLTLLTLWPCCVLCVLC